MSGNQGTAVGDDPGSGGMSEEGIQVRALRLEEIDRVIALGMKTRLCRSEKMGLPKRKLHQSTDIIPRHSGACRNPCPATRARQLGTTGGAAG